MWGEGCGREGMGGPADVQGGLRPLPHASQRDDDDGTRLAAQSAVSAGKRCEEVWRSVEELTGGRD